MSYLPELRLVEAIDAVTAAEGALARAAGEFPDIDDCPIRAVIDVERGILKEARRRLLAARAALAKGAV